MCSCSHVNCVFVERKCLFFSSLVLLVFPMNKHNLMCLGGVLNFFESITVWYPFCHLHRKKKRRKKEYRSYDQFIEAFNNRSSSFSCDSNLLPPSFLILLVFKGLDWRRGSLYPDPWSRIIGSVQDQEQD